MDRQAGDPGSTLQAIRGFLHWRRQQRALVRGGIRFLDSPEDTLLFERSDEVRLVVAFNLADTTVTVPLPADLRVERLEGHGFNGRVSGDGIALDGLDAFFGRVIGLLGYFAGASRFNAAFQIVIQESDQWNQARLIAGEARSKLRQERFCLPSEPLSGLY